MSSKHDFSNITTLKGMSLEERKLFSWNNLRHFFRVTLWDIDHLCKLCGKEIDRLDLATLDHILPKYYGGVTRLSNLRLAHERCNSNRNHSNPEYTQQRTRILKRFTGKGNPTN